MAVRPIPDEHHVVRHCKKRETIREDGILIGMHPAAFNLRPANPPVRPEAEKYLSCTYYEHFVGSAAEMMKRCCQALSFRPKENDGMIRLNVAKIKTCFQKYSTPVRITHEPKPASPSYAAIRPGKIDNPIAGLLATLAVVEMVSVSEVLE